ncbi:MAG: hypothetical protein FWF13_06670 [Acidobacteria bacterium]|nr:hypothetical protein [Acidobacteriota bacterium]
MPECDNQKKSKKSSLISRRDFARGSAAAMGAYAVADAAAALQEPSAGAKEIKIEKSAEIAKLTEDRHITDDNIRDVIANAEKTGRKLYKQDSDHLLSKLRMGQTYFYVEYSPAGESTFKIHAAWAHRFVILREPY